MKELTIKKLRQLIKKLKKHALKSSPRNFYYFPMHESVPEEVKKLCIESGIAVVQTDKDYKKYLKINKLGRYNDKNRA